MDARAPCSPSFPPTERPSLGERPTAVHVVVVQRILLDRVGRSGVPALHEIVESNRADRAMRITTQYQLGPPLQHGRKDGTVSPITREMSPRPPRPSSRVPLCTTCSPDELEGCGRPHIERPALELPRETGTARGWCRRRGIRPRCRRRRSGRRAAACDEKHQESGAHRERYLQPTCPRDQRPIRPIASSSCAVRRSIRRAGAPTPMGAPAEREASPLDLTAPAHWCGRARPVWAFASRFTRGARCLGLSRKGHTAC
jgi:hypothetical protein